MTTTKTQGSVATKTGPDLIRRVAAGAVGGLMGGLVFGMMMQVMGMITMVAMLVGSDSAAVGWVVHLAISVALGAGFGLISIRGLDSWGRGIGMGVAYGVVWWVLGALVAMPARLGMPVFMVNTMALQSLMGHLIFGAVLGAVAVAAVRAGSRRA
jgi:uncharacterized membrane protein YagU involved in acid resistance